LSIKIAKNRREKGLIEKIAKANIQLNRWAIKKQLVGNAN
jgi:hypothetical protein